MENAIKQAEMRRRQNGKTVLTCLRKTVTIQVSGNWLAHKAKKKALEKYEAASLELVSKTPGVHLPNRGR